MLKKCILKFGFTLLLILSCSQNLNAEITRAAIDVGSATIKVTIANVDIETQKISQILYSKEYNLPLQLDMQITGVDKFSESIQKIALDTFAKIKEECAVFQPIEWSGIATAASRKSKNAQELYDQIRNELGIPITIIPQEEEGRLGFVTAAATSGFPKEHLIAYDSGSGSFQLTGQVKGNLEVAQGQIAYISALATLITEIRGEKLDSKNSPNPLSIDEAAKMVESLQKRLPTVSKSFAEKLKDQKTCVAAIGTRDCIFANVPAITGSNIYTKDELWQVIENHCGMNDQQLKKFPSAKKSMVGMVLLYSVMDGFDIDELSYFCVNGSCEGLLIDPHYWTLTEPVIIAETEIPI